VQARPHLAAGVLHSRLRSRPECVIRIRSRLLFVTLQACSAIGCPAEIFEHSQRAR
jgi:hypothetical protein